MIQDGWILAKFFCVFMDLDEVEVDKKKAKVLDNLHKLMKHSSLASQEVDFIDRMNVTLW